MKKFIAVALLVCFGFAVAEGTEYLLPENHFTISQDSQKKKSSASAKKFRRRLPNYYDKTGVSRKQRQTIYDIQKDYFDRMQPLQDRLAQLKQQRDKEVYDVLSDEQKKILAELKAEALKKRAKRRKGK